MSLIKIKLVLLGKSNRKDKIFHLKMHLANSIKSVIILCQIFGLVAFAQNKNNFKWVHTHFNKIMSLASIVTIFIFFVLCLVFNGLLFDENETNIQTAIICISLLLLYLHVFTAMGESFWKRNQQIKLLNLFQTLESMSKPHKEFQFDYKGIKSISYNSILFWALQTFGLLSFNVIVLMQTEDKADMYFILAFAPAFIFSKLSYIYSMILITILHKNLNALIKYANSLSASVQQFQRNNRKNSIQLRWIDRNVPRTRWNDIDENKVAFLKRFFGLIWRASVLINDIFYWSWIIGIINESSMLVFNCFFFTMNAVNRFQANAWTIMYLALWTIMHVMNILFVTFTCGNATLMVISIDFLNICISVNFYILRSESCGNLFRIFNQTVLALGHR